MDWIKAPFAAIWRLMQQIYGALRGAIGWVVSLVVAIIAFVKEVAETIVWGFTIIIDAIAGIVQPNWDISTSVFTSEMLAFINTIFPLVEAWAMCVTLGAIWVTVIIIRWIKSFVPTVSG